MNDGELLQQYQAKGCEASFREIVRRHLGLVRGVAGRTLGDGADAGAVDDVAMRVFAIVARKAESLARHPSLAGWLVVATRQESLRLARNERTRHAAMTSYAHENTPAAAPADEPAWAEAKPHLDAALAHLGMTDREVVMLRFYEDRGFREIGQRLGRGEDAARKRVGAALEKMGAFFRRHGVALPASALGALMASHLPAAPAPDAARISAGALSIANAGKAWTLASALQAHPVAAFFVSLLTAAAATGGGMALGSAKAAAFHEPVAPLSEKRAVALPPDRSRSTSSTRAADSTTVEQWAAELVQTRRQGQESWEGGYGRLLDRIELTPDQCPGVIAALDATHRENFHLHDTVVRDVFHRWSNKEPRLACEAAVQRWKAGLSEPWQLHSNLWEGMRTWGKANGREALTWLHAQQIPASIASALAEVTFDGMVETDPAGAVEYLSGLSWEDRRSALRDVDLPGDPTHRAALLEKLAAVSDEETRADIFTHTLARRSQGVSMEEFQRLGFTRSDAGWSAMQAMADRMVEADRSHLRALDFLWQNAPQEARPAILRRHFTPFRERESRAASDWMRQRGLTDADVDASVR